MVCTHASKKKIILYLIITYFICFVSGGCSVIRNADELRTLKRLRDNEIEIQRYINEHEKAFSKLREEVINERLKQGTSKRSILSQFGDPIFCRNVRGQAPGQQYCLYRRPVKFFNTDMIYLYFDSEEKLQSWNYRPVSENQG